MRPVDGDGRLQAHPTRRRAAVAVALLAALVLAAGCGDRQVDSSWRPYGLEIDGQAADWHGHLTYVEKLDADVGLANDDQFVYVCIVPHQASTAHAMMTRGLIVWFNASGDESKSLGLRFPLGAAESPETMAALRRLRDGSGDREQVKQELHATLAQMDILRGGESERVSRDQAGPFEVAVELQNARSVVYEARVPLRSSDGGIGAEPGRAIGIGLETPEIDRSDLANHPPGMGRGMQGGGFGGGDMGGGGPGGGGWSGHGGPGRGRPGGEPVKPLAGWARVHLVKTEQAAPAAGSEATAAAHPHASHE